MSSNNKKSEKDMVQLPAMMIPSFRTAMAIERGVHKNILFKTFGGIGDQICAEPTLRYAFKTFKGLQISLASEKPELFSHLPFNKVFNLKEEHPVWGNYLVFDTIFPPQHLSWEFFSHMLTNCVDYVSLCTLRSQIPVADRELKLVPSDECFRKTSEFVYGRSVVIHPGRHWPIKTFPKDWWDGVLAELIKADIMPVLIGADADDNRGTVDVNPEMCTDLRNRLSIMETIALLQQSKVLVTNDSSPLHMAASGNASIGFIATCKHPDFITHWRNGQWGWRMKSLGKGGIWDVLDHCPNKENEVKVDQIEEGLLRSWLPEPKEVVEWAVSRL